MKRDKVLEGLERMVGKRVEIHPRFDRWARGDKFGEVTRVRKIRGQDAGLLMVKMDKSEQVVAFHADDLEVIK